MNKNLHDIDDLFRNSIEGHAEEVPPDVWKNIDHGLDKKQAAFYKRRYFTVRAAAILLFLAGGVAIAAILHYRSTEKVIKDETVVTTKESNGSTGDVQNKVVNDLKEDQGKEIEKTVVVDNAAEKAQGDKKENSKEYQSSENGEYSAQKNKDIPVKTNANKIYQQRKTGPVVNPLTYEIPQQGKVQQETPTQTTIKNVSAEEINKDPGVEDVNKFARTAYVDATVLSINRFKIENNLPAANSTSSIVPDFGSISSSTKTSKSKNSSGSWSIAPMYAQNINLNTLKDDDHFRDPRNNSSEAKRTEQETKSFTAGLGVQKELGGNFVLQSGLQYFSSQTTIKPKMIFAERDGRGEIHYRFNCSSGESYIPTKNGMPPPAIGDSIKTKSATSSLSYLQIPLLASYRINAGRFSILPSAGIQSNFLLSGKLTSSLSHPTGDEEVSTSIGGLRSLFFSGVIQPQLNYKLSDRISFDLDPNINFSLSPINKETAIKAYQNMFSLGAGLRIRL